MSVEIVQKNKAASSEAHSLYTLIDVFKTSYCCTPSFYCTRNLVPTIKCIVLWVYYKALEQMSVFIQWLQCCAARFLLPYKLHPLYKTSRVISSTSIHSSDCHKFSFILWNLLTFNEYFWTPIVHFDSQQLRTMGTSPSATLTHFICILITILYMIVHYMNSNYDIHCSKYLEIEMWTLNISIERPHHVPSRLRWNINEL